MLNVLLQESRNTEYIKSSNNDMLRLLFHVVQVGLQRTWVQPEGDLNLRKDKFNCWEKSGSSSLEQQWRGSWVTTGTPKSFLLKKCWTRKIYIFVSLTRTGFCLHHRPVASLGRKCGALPPHRFQRNLCIFLWNQQCSLSEELSVYLSRHELKRKNVYFSRRTSP